MEATGVYGWTDPIDPDGARRRPHPPTDEPPAWLTDRPEPRSAYLFGDEPERPGDDLADAPTAQWPTGPAGPPYAGPDPTPAAPPTGRLDPAAHPGAPGAPFLPPGDWRHGTGGLRAVDADPPVAGQGRHRQRSRFPRTLVIGGAAAAATLVVSLGVGALALPGGNGGEADPASVDDTVAAAPLAPDTDTGAPADALAATATATTSPTGTPATARPTPSASRTAKPTPAPTRTTAPSRQSAARTGGGTANSVSPGVSSQAQQVVDLVNAERAKAGCGKLGVDDKLMLAAQRHSQDQADHQEMSHTGSDGSDAGDRIDRVGYTWRTYGENVAWNQKTPAAVMDAWMTSPGHRANILNCAFTEIGVGVASSNGPYWTQVFAAPR
ncbi:CAP domain-containing protein [Micromonospora sp. NPDC047548]|uniref:CAP domain-containing protein n=1 Tax=Micromonospora sp. NPDC047548 TaxID=3155624 RepID=UPI0033D8CBB5